jgi:hypothetical protein
MLPSPVLFSFSSKVGVSHDVGTSYTCMTSLPCMAFRHRDPRMGRLIETAEVCSLDVQPGAGEREHRLSEVQCDPEGGMSHELRRKARWREEWMRDRALLRALLQKNPQTPPQDLAQATGRKVELGQEMAQAANVRCPQRSPSVVFAFTCPSCPLFPASIRAWKPAWWTCVSPRKTHLGRTPGPRALLYYLPRDRELQTLPVRLPRSSRTIWKILHRHGCIWSHKKKSKPLEPRERALGNPDGC